jgi:hypothetical protein
MFDQENWKHYMPSESMQLSSSPHGLKDQRRFNVHLEHCKKPKSHKVTGALHYWTLMCWQYIKSPWLAQVQSVYLHHHLWKKFAPNRFFLISHLKNTLFQCLSTTHDHIYGKRKIQWNLLKKNLVMKISRLRSRDKKAPKFSHFIKIMLLRNFPLKK